MPDDLFSEEKNDSYHDTVKREKEKEWAPQEEPDKDALQILSGRD